MPPPSVLPIDKSPGMTSHDVVARARRALRPAKVKVGHAGTLDPDATGLLLVCIGAATRLADLLAEQGKTYHAHFQFGVTTSSEDSSGEVIAEKDASHITREMVVETLASLTGAIEQVPPMVSAVHHEGKRLYELARQGIEVERDARTVQIDRIELTEFATGIHPAGELRIDCGKGTYVRTLCADLGAKLGVGGHMTMLRRLRIGGFQADGALPVDEISAETIAERSIAAGDAVSFLPIRILTEPERSAILLGKAIVIGEVVGDPHGSGWVRLVGESGELVALGIVEGDALYPKKVLAPVSQ